VITKIVFLLTPAIRNPSTFHIFREGTGKAKGLSEELAITNHKLSVKMLVSTTIFY
jgi:hypothetical protein